MIGLIILAILTKIDNLQKWFAKFCNYCFQKVSTPTKTLKMPRTILVSDVPALSKSTSNGKVIRKKSATKKEKSPEREKTSPPEYTEGRYDTTEAVSVKVAHLRQVGQDIMANFKDWLEDDNNYYVGRHGRVFIGSKADKFHFSYDGSIFANPFKVNSKTKLVVSLVKYINHLVSNPDLFDMIPNLKGLNLGCFCDQLSQNHGLCHASILASMAQNFDACKDMGVHELFNNIYGENKGNDDTVKVKQMFGLSELVSDEDFVARVEAAFQVENDDDYSTIDMNRLSSDRPNRENRYYTVKQLRDICAFHDIGTISNMKKSELVEVITRWINSSDFSSGGDEVEEVEEEVEEVVEEVVEEENDQISEVVEIYDENEDIDDDKNDLDDASSEVNEDEEKARDPDYVDGEE